MANGHFSLLSIFLYVNNCSCNFQFFSDVTVLIKQLCYLYCLELLVVWNQNFTPTTSIFCICWQFLAKFFLNNTIYFIVSICHCLFLSYENLLFYGNEIRYSAVFLHACIFTLQIFLPRTHSQCSICRHFQSLIYKTNFTCTKMYTHEMLVSILNVLARHGSIIRKSTQ